MLNFNTVPNGNGDTGTEKVLNAGTRNELARLGSGNELIQLIHIVLIQKKKKKKNCSHFSGITEFISVELTIWLVELYWL